MVRAKKQQWLDKMQQRWFIFCALVLMVASSSQSAVVPAGKGTVLCQLDTMARQGRPAVKLPEGFQTCLEAIQDMCAPATVESEASACTKCLMAHGSEDMVITLPGMLDTRRVGSSSEESDSESDNEEHECARVCCQALFSLHDCAESVFESGPCDVTVVDAVRASRPFHRFTRVYEERHLEDGAEETSATDAETGSEKDSSEKSSSEPMVTKEDSDEESSSSRR